ncbi:MAG: site-specific integrase [Mariprofundales bacterium]
MIPIPVKIERAFLFLLQQKRLSENVQRNYTKWLRFYLDFCYKYEHNPNAKQSQHAFNNKLIAKNQTHDMRSDAWQAVNNYLEYIAQLTPINEKIDLPMAHSAPDQWVVIYEELRNAVLIRHYSPKTLAAYRGWVRKIQGFVHNSPPAELSMEDVKTFLTHLAVEKHVSASTQNQAFKVVQAKYKKRIPVVLARKTLMPYHQKHKQLESVLNGVRYKVLCFC